MRTRHIISAICLLTIFWRHAASAQTDSATVRMQKMICKIILQAPDDFIKLKGAEVSRNEKSTAYMADLTKTITDANEMKNALATNFFGSMLTADDVIVETGGSTIYLARYDDIEITDVVAKAFLGLPAYLGPGNNAKIEDLKTETTTAHAYILSIKGTNIARFNYDADTGKGSLLIGIKK